MRACNTLHGYYDGKPIYINPKTVNMIRTRDDGGCYVTFNSGDDMVFKETAEEARDIIYPDVQLSDIFNMSEPTFSLL